MEFRLTCAVFGLAAFFMSWKEADALKCYKCTGCNDPFEESAATVTDCTHSCVKAKAESGSTQIVTRDCWPSAENKCEKESYGGVEANVCVCTTDKCNGVESHTAYKLTFVVSSAFVILFKHLLI